MATPAPTSPHPGDPQRSHPRCSAHDRPATWDGATWRCSRGRPPGHVLPNPRTGADVVWGPPPAAQGRPVKRRGHEGDEVHLFLDDLAPIVRAEAAREAPAGKRPNVTATLHGLIRDGLAHRGQPVDPQQ